MSRGQKTSPESSTAESGGISPSSSQPLQRRAFTYIQREIDSKACSPISIYACFLTGFTASISFSACYVWCGFQTGNVAQLGLAVARTFDPQPYRTYGFQKPDQQAFTSLLSFLLGTTCGRVGDKIGAKRRSWLVLASFFQALLAMAGALCAHFSGQSGIARDRDFPSWTNALGLAALGFLSATLGLQGIIGKRTGSEMNTTVVLTTTWVEIFNDPFLFALRPIRSRDVRILGVACVFFGAFVARALSGTRCGPPGTIGILVALRLVQTAWWASLRGPPPKAVIAEK